jgi:protein transport protein SEC61 subunit gamma-like protein
MTIATRFREFIDNSRRILNISYKPSNEEFRKTAKVILLGIILIGAVGFIIGLIVYFITTGTLL